MAEVERMDLIKPTAQGRLLSLKDTDFVFGLSKTKKFAVLGAQRRRFSSFKDGLRDSACLISKTVVQRRKTKIFRVRISHHKNISKILPMLSNQLASTLVSYDLIAWQQSWG